MDEISSSQYLQHIYKVPLLIDNKNPVYTEFYGVLQSTNILKGENKEHYSYMQIL